MEFYVRIALAQINSTVGDLAGNAAKILDFARRADGRGADVAVFPELALTGYPPRDLLEKESFVQRAECVLRRLANDAAGLNTAIVCGTIAAAPLSAGNRLYNSAAVIEHGEIAFRQHKMLLPSYDVFDETRYFEPAERQHTLVLGGSKIALTICE